MPLIKHVADENGGYTIQMTPEEEAAFIAASTPLPPTKDALIKYADAKLYRSSNAGTLVNIAPDGDTPIMASAATDADGNSDVLGLLMQAQMGITSWPWYQSGGILTLDAAALTKIAGAVSYHRGYAFAVWQGVVTGINADAVTTFAQIDAAGWPSGS